MIHRRSTSDRAAILNNADLLLLFCCYKTKVLDVKTWGNRKSKNKRVENIFLENSVN